MFNRKGVTNDQLQESKTIFKRFSELLDKLKSFNKEPEEKDKSNN